MKMTNGFLTIAATAVMVLVGAPKMSAATDEALLLSANGVTATITLSTTGVLAITCTGTVAQCGDFTAASTAGTFIAGAKGGFISDNGQNASLSVTNATLNGYTISDTASGWVDSTAPTLQTFNQVVAKGGVGTVTSEFTDINYNTPGTPLSSIFNIADSNVSDSGISGSTVQFGVFSSPGNAIPATSTVYSNTLTGASSSNGAHGANAINPNTTGSVSISSATILTFTGTGKIQANMTVANAAAVPEPASIVLMGTMILGLTALIRKKQVKQS